MRGFDAAQWAYDNAEPADELEALRDELDREQAREDHLLEQAERRADAESDPHWTPGDQP